MPLQTWDEFLPVLIGARRANHLTQTVLAAQIGVAPSAISLWESRVRTPTQENAELWADALGVKMPAYATLWFRRKSKAETTPHGTRNGYQWHRRYGDMPACEPCRKAAAEYMRGMRREGRG